MLIIVIPLRYWFNGKYYTQKIYIKLYTGLFFDNMVTILFEAYMEFIIAGCFNAIEPINTYFGEILG